MCITQLEQNKIKHHVVNQRSVDNSFQDFENLELAIETIHSRVINFSNSKIGRKI